MNKNKPIIGLSTSFEKTETGERIFLMEDYLEAVRHFGGIPLLIPTTAEAGEQQLLLQMCDGLILTGGNDLDPRLYGEEILNDTVEPAPERDAAEYRLCEGALAAEMPILGICRGMQLLNVYFGGTLYQDIPSQVKTNLGHRPAASGERLVHDCKAEASTPMALLLGQEAFAVNTYHHQAAKALAPGLRAMAKSPDGMIEAIYKPDGAFLWGVQWHPERIWRQEESSAKVFEAFLDACQK